MTEKKDSSLLARLVIAIFLLGGILLIVAGEYLPDAWSTISAVLRNLGTTLVSIAAVSLAYEFLIAEKHFREFRRQLSQVVDEMEGLYSSCHRMGIRAIYASRLDYGASQSLMSRIEDMLDGSTVLCVGRSLFHLFNKLDELKRGLEKGLHFQFACIAPDAVDEFLKRTTFIKKSDISSTLEQLHELVAWAEKEKVRGSIELRFHRAGAADSALAYSSKTQGDILAWDLSFGRDAQDKTAIVMSIADKSLGFKLKERYEAIYADAMPQVSYANGVCKLYPLDL